MDSQSKRSDDQITQNCVFDKMREFADDAMNESERFWSGGR